MTPRTTEIEELKAAITHLLATKPKGWKLMVEAASEAIADLEGCAKHVTARPAENEAEDLRFADDACLTGHVARVTEKD